MAKSRVQLLKQPRKTKEVHRYMMYGAIRFCVHCSFKYFEILLLQIGFTAFRMRGSFCEPVNIVFHDLEYVVRQLRILRWFWSL